MLACMPKTLSPRMGWLQHSADCCEWILGMSAEEEEEKLRRGEDAQGCRGKRRGCVCQRGLPRTACAAAAALCAVQGRCLLLKRCRVQGVGGLVLSINLIERVACARRNACNVCFTVVLSIYMPAFLSLPRSLSWRAGSLCTRRMPEAGVEGGTQARVRAGICVRVRGCCWSWVAVAGAGDTAGSTAADRKAASRDSPDDGEG